MTVELAIQDELSDLVSDIVESSEEYEIPYIKGVSNLKYNLEDNLEEIQGLEVTIGHCVRVCRLLDPVETRQITVGQGINFVGELYFRILYQGVHVYDTRVE